MVGVKVSVLALVIVMFWGEKAHSEATIPQCPGPSCIIALNLRQDICHIAPELEQRL